MLAADPGDLEVYRLLAEIHRTEGNAAEAGRWGYLTGNATDAEVAEFERAHPQAWVRLQLLGWSGDPALLPSDAARTRLAALQHQVTQSTVPLTASAGYRGAGDTAAFTWRTSDGVGTAGGQYGRYPGGQTGGGAGMSGHPNGGAGTSGTPHGGQHGAPHGGQHGAPHGGQHGGHHGGQPDGLSDGRAGTAAAVGTAGPPLAEPGSAGPARPAPTQRGSGGQCSDLVPAAAVARQAHEAHEAHQATWVAQQRAVPAQRAAIGGGGAPGTLAGGPAGALQALLRRAAATSAAATGGLAAGAVARAAAPRTPRRAPAAGRRSSPKVAWLNGHRPAGTPRQKPGGDRASRRVGTTGAGTRRRRASRSRRRAPWPRRRPSASCPSAGAAARRHPARVARCRRPGAPIAGASPPGSPAHAPSV
jgi:hypothetical protein